MIENTPPTFEIFKDIMTKYLAENYDRYLDFMAEYSEYEGKKIKSGLYSMVVDIRFNTLQKKLKNCICSTKINILNSYIFHFKN